MTAADTTSFVVDGRTVRLTSLERVLWPKVGMTKAHLVDYLVSVAPVLLPHISGHPITLRRYPEGVTGPSFFQTRTPPHPEWVRTQRMHVFESGKDVDAPVIDDLPSLLWAVNLTTLELHPYLARAEELDRPRWVVFDLDPGAPAGLVEACRVATMVRAILVDLGLRSCAKTSGGAGMHVYVPVGGAQRYAESKPFARAIAGLITRDHSELVTDRMARHLRPGKVFIDWSQNDPGKSTVAPYSTRGLDLPTVSTPVLWDEVEAVADGAPWQRLVFGPGEVLERLHRLGDVFAPVLGTPQTLPVSGA